MISTTKIFLMKIMGLCVLKLPFSSSFFSHLYSMPRIELSTPWTPPTAPVKIYGDVKNTLDAHPPKMIDLYSRPLHRQPSEKVLQQRYRCLQPSEFDTRSEAPPSTPFNLTRTNKTKPEMSINKPQRLPEQHENLVCPSPKTPQFNVQFLHTDNDMYSPAVSNGASQVKALLATGRHGGRSILGRKFPKCTGKLCNMR